MIKTDLFLFFSLNMDGVYANGIMNGGGGNIQSHEMAQAQTVLNWNPNQLDIKTKSVEKTLEPLVMQVGKVTPKWYKKLVQIVC